jgi:hypothetical protein
MPEYESLFEQGIYDLDQGVRVFAGTTDDAFFIDLGATFDTLNLRVPVLSDAQDTTAGRFAPDDVSGYNVNTIALQVPIKLLTRNGNQPGENDRDATIGTYGSISRKMIELRRPGREIKGRGPSIQVQRMGNPLFNELIIGTGFKDDWSRAQPVNDADFAAFALDPLIARAAQAAFGGA